MLKCSTCNLRFKGVGLNRCKHLFCKECVESRLNVRARKCPTCQAPFGKDDVFQVSYCSPLCSNSWTNEIYRSSSFKKFCSIVLHVGFIQLPVHLYGSFFSFLGIDYDSPRCSSVHLVTLDDSILYSFCFSF